MFLQKSLNDVLNHPHSIFRSGGRVPMVYDICGGVDLKLPEFNFVAEPVVTPG